MESKGAKEGRAIDFCRLSPAVRVKAAMIALRLDLKGIDGASHPGQSSALVMKSGDGCAVLFRYGVVVLCNVAGREEASLLKKLAAKVIDPLPGVVTEELVVDREPEGEERVEAGRVILRGIAAEHLLMVAEVLARSVVLEHYENTVAGVFDRIEPFASGLKASGKSGWKGRDLARQIGSSLLVQHQMAARVEIEDRPELLWDHPGLERLYERLEDEYEIRERHKALVRKLDLVARTAETILTLQYDKRSLRVEWYIVALIVVEIVILLFELLFLR